jgi:hypothetical protein
MKLGRRTCPSKGKVWENFCHILTSFVYVCTIADSQADLHIIVYVVPSIRSTRVSLRTQDCTTETRADPSSYKVSAVVACVLQEFLQSALPRADRLIPYWAVSAWTAISGLGSPNLPKA